MPESPNWSEKVYTRSLCYINVTMQNVIMQIRRRKNNSVTKAYPGSADARAEYLRGDVGVTDGQKRQQLTNLVLCRSLRPHI